MRTQEYIVREFNKTGQLTALKKVEETYSDNDTLCKLHEEDHLNQTTEEWDSDMDTLGRVVRKSNDEHTYHTKKDERGRFVYIEHILHATGSRQITTISYYENCDKVYQEITTNDLGYRYEDTYTYFGVVVQIDSIVRYGENSEDENMRDYRTITLQDPYREFYTKYDLSTQRLLERGFAYYNEVYSKELFYGADGEQHTHCIQKEYISEHESHICEYEDDVLTSCEVTLSFIDPVTKMAWQMQETTDLKTNTRTLDRIWITKTLKGEQPVLLW